MIQNIMCIEKRIVILHLHKVLVMDTELEQYKRYECKTTKNAQE